MCTCGCLCGCENVHVRLFELWKRSPEYQKSRKEEAGPAKEVARPASAALEQAGQSAAPAAAARPPSNQDFNEDIAALMILGGARSSRVVEDHAEALLTLQAPCHVKALARRLTKEEKEDNQFAGQLVQVQKKMVEQLKEEEHAARRAARSAWMGAAKLSNCWVTWQINTF